MYYIFQLVKPAFFRYNENFALGRWFGQPKYSTPTKKSFYVVSTSASIFFILYLKPIRSLLSQRTPEGSFRDDIAGITSNSLSVSHPSSSSSSFSLPSTSALLSLTSFYYIDTDEIPGFLLLLKNHIFTARSEDTIKIVSSLRAVKIWFFTCEDIGYPLTIRPVARKGYGSIAHEAKPHGPLIRGPWGRRV